MFESVGKLSMFESRAAFHVTTRGKRLRYLADCRLWLGERLCVDGSSVWPSLLSRRTLVGTYGSHAWRITTWVQADASVTLQRRSNFLAKD